MNDKPRNTINRNIFEIKWPSAVDIPLIMDSPHSGRHYPKYFKYNCSKRDLEHTEDRFVEQLFSDITSLNIPFLHALFPRSYIDVNRPVSDIDPLVVKENDILHMRPTARSQAGIGLIQRSLKTGQNIYNDKIDPQDVQYRIDRYYHPYHTALQNLTDYLYNKFGQVWHINCHSMPSTTRRVINTTNTAPQNSLHKNADFVLGDRDGTSCAKNFTQTIRDFLKKQGFNVAINTPYKGVEIVKKHGKPPINRHSIQLEINRALYLNETTLETNNNFNNIKETMGNLSICIQSFIQDQMQKSSIR